jgi:hypothetical protein
VETGRRARRPWKLHGGSIGFPEKNQTIGTRFSGIKVAPRNLGPESSIMVTPTKTMVPGMMVYSGKGDVTWARTHRDLDFQRGRDDAFMDLYKRFLFAKHGAVPRYSDLDFPTLIGPDLLGTSHVLGVAHENPDNFTFESFGKNTTVGRGLNYLGKHLGTVPFPGFRRSVQDVYEIVKKTKRALLSEVRTQQDDSEISYRRLVIPVANKHDEVTNVLVSVIRS